MPITRIGIRNFRCIKSLDLKLPPLTVVVGPNGAGKSTLLGSFQLLSRLSRNELTTAFVDYGGFDASLCWYSHADRMSFDVSASIDALEFDYSTEFVKTGSAHTVAAEELNLVSPSLPYKCILRTTESSSATFYINDAGVRGIQTKPATEALLPLAATSNTHTRNLLETLKRVSYLSASQLSLDAGIRKPQALQPAAVPSQDGDDLLSVLYTMKTEQRERYVALIESLQVLFPELDSIELPLAGKGFASLNWYQKGLKKPLDAQQLSDGTLRLLWLVTVLYTVPDDGLVLIDEPEISLHPQWLMVLVSLLRETSARTQIIVATHSDQLVRWLKPDELLLADTEDGVSRFTWANEVENLGEWLKEYTLDRLWLMGELGGRR